MTLWWALVLDSTNLAQKFNGGRDALMIDLTGLRLAEELPAALLPSSSGSIVR